MNRKSFLLAAVLLVIGFSGVQAQAGRPRQSPKVDATGKIGKANVTISYSSPAVKGRTVWGELVPYGKVWRAGANEATTIETDRDLTIQGKKLPAGKYSLYAIPGEKEWQMIFNQQTGQWGIQRGGETTRDVAKDVLVVNVKPRKSGELQENLMYTINKKGFALKWEHLEVPVTVK